MYSLISLFTLSTLFSTQLIHAYPTTCIGTNCPVSVSQPNSIPLNGLPAPTGLTLKYIALGLGTQNYTCASATSAPTSIGALAVLYDATFLALPISAPLIPKYATLAYNTHSSLGLPTIGHHYFSAQGVPTFSLEAANPSPALLSAKKVANVAAPADSVKSSIDWLELVDNGLGLSKGLKAVYRVETAGGAAPASCASAGVVTVQYAAEYW